MATIKKQLLRLIDARSGEWLDEQIVWLGDYNQTVQTPTPGVFYARQVNGKVIEVYNSAHVPPTFDLQVKIGRSKSLPAIWQIIAIRETYIDPAAGGELAYHHEQHEFPGGDTVWVNRKQILEMTVLVSDAALFIVRVYGGVIRIGNSYVKVSHQTFDLSAYVITAGARFVNIEANDTGTLSAHVGTTIGSREISTTGDIPVPTEGNIVIASVQFYEAQTLLSDDDIFIPSVIERGGVSAQIYSATVRKIIHDNDLFGYYGTSEGRLRSISFMDFKQNIKGYAEQLYAVILNKLSTYLPLGSAAGGDLAGTYPNPSVAAIRGVLVDSGLAPADGDTLVYNLATTKYISAAGGGGGGGTPIVYEDLSGQIPAASDHFVLGTAASGAVLLFYNTTLQSTGTFAMDVGGLGLTTTAFSPVTGDKLIAVYGISGALTDISPPPAMRVYMNRTFTF